MPLDDDSIRDIFSGLGPVTIRRMFGGKGVYFDGVIVGLALSTGEMLLKGDAESGRLLEEAGATRWAYDGKGRAVNMPYWSIPEDAYDDPDEMKLWTSRAYEAALRSQK